ncbi:hypothetical protein FJ955_22190 [Mesorhizobium sp. B2-2-2]|nr:hypothetical protein FJ955_22190 [Mesorhizobium sp. B2-2-2]
MGEMVQDLLRPDAEDGLGQGEVKLKRIPTTPGPNPWDPPVEGAPVLYDLKAAVKRVDQRYKNGVLIVETVDLITSAVPEVEPLMTDTLAIDGRERVITSLKPFPFGGCGGGGEGHCGGVEL